MISILLAAAMAAGPADRPPYNIQIDPVKEVCILGHADLAYWEAVLRREDLRPIARDGRAELLLCTFSSRFMGLSFSEGIVSVFATPEPGDPARSDSLLVQAYNSRPSFAWIERTLNKSPYLAATITSSVQAGSSFMAITAGDQRILDARMTGHAAPARVEPMVWEGAIHLPRPPASEKAPSKLFYARLEGETQVFPFQPGQDRLEIGNPASSELCRHLVESHFTASEWWIRSAGRHAKSKTISRG